MRLLRLVLAPGIAMVALSAVGTAAQEASPEPSASASLAPMEADPVAVPLPAADYWVEWNDHKQASHQRAINSIQDAKRSGSKTARWYQILTSVHKDELQWLANHEPMACYVGEFEQWREATEDLHSIHTKALRSVRANNAAGVRRADKQRPGAMKRLNKALANVASCGPSVPDTTEGNTSDNPMVGTWKTMHRFVNERKANVTHQASAKITRDGRFLLRVKRDDFCRKSGLGPLPLTAEGGGEFITDGTLQFNWGGAKLHCYPRRGGRKLVLEGGSSDIPWHYHEAYDVLTGVQGGGNCSWRAKGGSPKDCKAFWRGTPAPVEAPEVPVVEIASPGEDATAPPDPVEG